MVVMQFMMVLLGQIILLTIYDKQEKENISEAELRQLKAEVRAMLGL